MKSTTAPRITGLDFADKRLPGYRNINEIFRQTNRLHCCETLFGDYDASLLIVLQDAADYQTMLTLHQRTGENPFIHNPRLETNRNLFNSLKPYFPVGESVENPNNQHCGIYYANAAWLLKESSGLQGRLTNPVQACDPEILQATLQNLPKLKLVIACGQAAYASVSALTLVAGKPLQTPWKEFRNQPPVKACIQGRELHFASTVHPGKRGVVARARMPDSSGLDGRTLLRQDFGLILASAGYQPLDTSQQNPV